MFFAADWIPSTISLTYFREYLKRLNLYRKRVWTCKTSGKTNLTYEEALVSEHRAVEKVQQFPKELMAPVLHMVQYSKRPSWHTFAAYFFFVLLLYLGYTSVTTCFFCISVTGFGYLPSQFPFTWHMSVCLLLYLFSFFFLSFFLPFVATYTYCMTIFLLLNLHFRCQN